MSFFTLVVVGLVAGLAYGILKTIATAKHNKQAKIAFDNLSDFKASNYYLSPIASFSMAFDNSRKKICFLDKMHKAYIYDYTQILQCELMVDGETVLKHSTSSMVGRAVLGGILTGGVGAIIGGVTGKSTQKETINNIDLKVIINDTSNPVFRINFLNLKVKKGTPLYKKAYQKIELWHGIISGLMRQGQDEKPLTAAANVPTSTGTPVSVADEIRKLKGLLDEGILTQEEFNAQKAKLISQPTVA